MARAIYESEIPVISAVGHEPDVTIADYVADARASTPSNAAEIAVPDRNDVRARLTALERSMTKTEESRLSALRERLTALERKRVLRDPMAFIADKRLLLDYTQKSLASLAEKQVGGRRQRFAALCASLHAMSPLAVLARGYAVARTANGTVLRSADEVTVGETIDVTLGRGSLACTVNETRGENSHGKKALRITSRGSEEIVSQLERGDAKLADSLKLFEEGRSSSPPAEKCSMRRSRRSYA